MTWLLSWRPPTRHNGVGGHRAGGLRPDSRHERGSHRFQPQPEGCPGPADRLRGRRLRRRSATVRASPSTTTSFECSAALRTRDGGSFVLHVGTTLDDVAESTESSPALFSSPFPSSSLLLARSGLVVGGAHPQTGRRDSVRSRGDRCHRSPSESSAPPGQGRDRPARRNHERDARSPRKLGASASSGSSATLPTSCVAPWRGCGPRSRSTLP